MKSPLLKREDPRIVLVIAAGLSISMAALTVSYMQPQALPQSPVRQIVYQGQSSLAAKNLLFYNRPPKTGSTTIRIAFKEALDKLGMVSARCFNKIEWNEMAVKTIINRREIDFYGCHTRLITRRYNDISQMRSGNVTFITSTRDPKNIILSAFLQFNRDRNIPTITDPEQMKVEVQRYKDYIEKYPVDALYRYHGAENVLRGCPVQWEHQESMRFVAERYEVVIDLDRPEESATMVEAVTGIRPDFSGMYNTRTLDTSGPMLAELMKVDTSYKTCGNVLVHNTLKQQFNIIKDRLMQNRCFDEDTGTYELCEKAVLTKDEIRERNRKESFQARTRLLQ